MANLTITVNEETLKRARIRAIAQGESVNKVLARTLEEYAAGDELKSRKERAAQRFVALSEQLAGHSNSGWSREELYDDRYPRADR